MNKDLRDKLFNFQAPPSAGLWNKIAHSLDDDTEYSIAERMLQYEATPPSKSWEHIVEILDRDNKTVVSFKRNYSFLKYAGVAAALIICVVISYMYLSDKQDDHQLSSVNEKRILIPPPALDIPSEKIRSNDKNDIAEAEKREHALPASHARMVSAIRLHPSPSRNYSSIKNKFSRTLPPKKPLVSSELVERYIVFSKTTGEAVRLSKKLFGLFACSERDISCDKNIKSVQQKMASGSMMASTDFTGILEALQTINKEQNN